MHFRGQLTVRHAWGHWGSQQIDLTLRQPQSQQPRTKRLAPAVQKVFSPSDRRSREVNEKNRTENETSFGTVTLMLNVYPPFWDKYYDLGT